MPSNAKVAQPWPRRAEGYRVDAFEAAEEIARLVRELQKPGLHIYEQRAIHAEIGQLAEYIQRAMVEAAQGTAPDRALEALEARVAALERALSEDGRLITLPARRDI